MYDYRTSHPKFSPTVPSVVNCRIITGHPNYFIDKDGRVYDMYTNKQVRSDTSESITLDGTTLNIDILLLHEYTGILPFPVITRNEEPITKTHIGYRSSKLTYWVDKIVCDDRPNVFWIDEVEFRRIPFATHNLVISRSGVIYDTTMQDFVMRTCVDGSACAYFYFNEEMRQKWAPSRSKFKIEQLLYTAYIGPIPKNYIVLAADPNLPISLDNIKIVPFVDFTRGVRAEYKDAPEDASDVMDTIARMISEGYGNAEIARRVGMPYETRAEKHRISSLIYKLKSIPGYRDDLKEKYNIASEASSVRGAKPRITPEQIEEIKELSKKGISGAEIGRQFNISRASVCKYLKS